jgi:AraC family transcriptional regulator, regulatory protein of adaptative response / DNA-3-methyladenine glycosylase II
MTTYSAVVTTGIYCRPGCGARPLAQNTRTFELAAAAEAAGFRACHRCRPYRVAGPVGSNPPEIVCEAVQLIIGGVLDNGGTEAALAGQVGMSSRHLRRLFRTHLGATPDQFARSRRAHFARRLLDDTDLRILDVAFASGFASLRQFNREMREVFNDAPARLRGRRHQADRLAADGGLALRLPVAPDYDWATVRSFLAARAIPGVEVLDGDTYRRTIAVAGSPGLLEVSPGRTTGPAGGHLLLRAHLPYWEGLIHIVDRVARLLGTDADPGAWNPFEAGVLTILSARPGHQHLLRTFVAQLGTPVPGLPAGLTHTFPDAASVTQLTLAPLGLPAPDTTAITLLAATLTASQTAPADSRQCHPPLGKESGRAPMRATSS